MGRRISYRPSDRASPDAFSRPTQMVALRIELIRRPCCGRICFPRTHRQGPHAEGIVMSVRYLLVALSLITASSALAQDAPASRLDTVQKIDKLGVTVIENPGGSNERFARANFKQAKIVIFNDNTTIFDEILKGNADVMISESVETIVQQKARPGLCAVNPDKPLQYGEMAWLLPRGDAAFKAWMDQWLHLAKATGDYDRITGRWLR